MKMWGTKKPAYLGVHTKEALIRRLSSDPRWTYDVRDTLPPEMRDRIVEDVVGRWAQERKGKVSASLHKQALEYLRDITKPHSERPSAPPPPPEKGWRAIDGYESLQSVLHEAVEQSAEGKGVERHGNGLTFEQQPILTITAAVGEGFPLGQAIKKITEARGFITRGENARARFELLGAIVYIAAAVLHLDHLLKKERSE